MSLFYGGKFPDKVSSEKLLAVSAAGPPAAFFPEIDISGFFLTCSFWKKLNFLYLMTFSKMAPQAKPLCPLDSYQKSVKNRGINVPRCLIRVQIHRDRLQI